MLHLNFLHPLLNCLHLNFNKQNLPYYKIINYFKLKKT